MGQGMTTAERTKVLGYRLSGHHLSEKVPTERLLEAAGACGLQNTPPGSAALSLLARVDGLTPMMLRSALLDRSLMEAWSMRASPTSSRRRWRACSAHAWFPTSRP